VYFGGLSILGGVVAKAGSHLVRRGFRSERIGVGFVKICGMEKHLLIFYTNCLYCSFCST